MFDIGFSEILMIAVVALIVIGPQRLPKVARTLGHLMGRAQRYVNGIKADITREMSLDEMRQFEQKAREQVDSAEQSFNQATQEIDKQINPFPEPSKVTNQSPIKHFSSVGKPPPVINTPVQQTLHID